MSAPEGTRRGVRWARPSPARLLALAAIGTLLLATWLLVPVGSEDAGDELPTLRTVLVDASASVVRTRPSWTAWARAELEREARAAGAAGQALCVIVFASDVRVRFGPGQPAAFEELLAGGGGRAPFDPAEGSGDDGASRVADALESALAVLREPAPRGGGGSPAVPPATPVRPTGGRLVLLGQPPWTGRDPAALLASLGARGVALELRPPPPPELAELGLEALELPAGIEIGAPTAATLRLHYVPGAGQHPSARLKVRSEEAGAVRGFEQALELPLGPARWSVRVPLGPAGLGRTQLRIEALLSSGQDPMPENDVLEGSYRGEGSLVLGVVCEPEAEQAARLVFQPSGVSALSGIEFVFLAPEELGALAAELDLLVTYDLSLERLPAALVEAFVRGGGGLFACAGWRMLADWYPGRARGPLEELLPLEPAAVEAPPRDVVLLVDGSGSMAGEPFDTVRAAALALVGAALPSDRLSLRFFTTGLEQELLLRERFDPAAARPDADTSAAAVTERLLRARVPGGQTMILRSLGQFAALERSRADEALVLLLSDGRERDTLARPLEAARRTQAELRAARARLVVIAVGEDPDEAFLRALVPEGEEVAHGSTLEELESIFRRSIGGARVRDGRIELRVAPFAEDSLVAEALGEPAAGDRAVELPPLARLVQNTLRPGGELAWESERGEPVLALWRVGAGRVAAFSSLPSRSWAPAWSGRLGAGEPRPLGPLLRWLARSGRSPEAAPVLTIEAPGEGGESAESGEQGVDRQAGAALLTLTGLSPAAPELVELRLASAAGEEQALVLAPRIEPSGVMAAGVRQGLARGAWAARLLERGSGWSAVARLEDGRERVLRVGRPVAREFRAAAPEQLAAAAAPWRAPSGVLGGKPGPAAAPGGGRAPGARQGPAGPLVLGLGLVLLFAWALVGNGRQGIGASGR